MPCRVLHVLFTALEEFALLVQEIVSKHYKGFAPTVLQHTEQSIQPWKRLKYAGIMHNRPATRFGCDFGFHYSFFVKYHIACQQNIPVDKSLL